MSVEIGKTLPDQVVRSLEGGNPVVVATADSQGRPRTGVMSWVRAVDDATVRGRTRPENAARPGTGAQDEALIPD